jgi:hypothetical protein
MTVANEHGQLKHLLTRTHTTQISVQDVLEGTMLTYLSGNDCSFVCNT